MKKALVTGAGGFIGSHLVTYLKEKGYWVRGVDIKSPEFSESDADEFIHLDLRDLTSCFQATKGMDEVYALAANMGGIGYISEVKAVVMRDNVLINSNTAEASYVNEVSKVFYASSACIYPISKQTDPEVTALKESDAYPAEPDNEYGWEKIFSERLYTSYLEDHEMDIRIGRFHNIYGPKGTYEGGREKAPAAICRKVAVANDGGEIEIWGDGEQTRSFCYIQDCCEGVYRLMHSGYQKPVNIGSDELVSINQLVDITSEIAGKKLTKKYLLDKPQGVRGRNSDNTLFEEVLNWRYQYSLEKGIKRTYEWIAEEVASKPKPQYV